MTTLDAVFVRFAAAKLRQYMARIEECAALLKDDQLWWRGADGLNSIGNLFLHLAGNVRQWILHGIAGEPDTRARPSEFAAHGGPARSQLLNDLRETVEQACTVIENLGPRDLLRKVNPQSYDVHAMEAVFHVVEHFGQHTGQIIFATKLLTGKDLGFYAHLSGSTPPSAPPSGQELP